MKDDNFLSALVDFLDSIPPGLGWRGPAMDLRPLVIHLVAEATELPMYELGWLSALAQRTTGLAEHGWVVTGLSPGHPIEFRRLVEATR